jgi:hypothetical protein
MTTWKIKMNADKTNYMVFGKEVVVDNGIFIGKDRIERVTMIKYLGVYIDDKLRLAQHQSEKTKQLLKSTYSLYSIGLMNNCMDVTTKSYIYKTYCRPILTYGWEFLETSEKTIKTMRTDECKCLKRILGVQKTAKNSLVYNALEITEPLNQIYVMKVKFSERLEKNELTRNLLKNLNVMFDLKELKTNSIVNDMKNLELKLGSHNLVNNVIKTYQEDDKLNIKNDGLIDSIRYCLNNRTKNFNLYKILYHLISGYIIR